MIAQEVILTRAEAIAYVKLGSRSALQRWCAKWNVPANRRYPKTQLDRGLEREARASRKY